MKLWVQSLAPFKPSVVVSALNPGIQEVEAENQKSKAVGGYIGLSKNNNNDDDDDDTKIHTM